MEEIQQNKRIIMVGLFTQQLKDLVEHLETTGYNTDEVNHLVKILNESNARTR